jgi:hypothetical protein
MVTRPTNIRDSRCSTGRAVIDAAASPRGAPPGYAEKLRDQFRALCEPIAPVLPRRLIG